MATRLPPPMVLLLALVVLPELGSADPFADQVGPFLNKYCADCHSGDDGEAGIAFDAELSVERARAATARWNQVRGLIELGAMPPADYDPLPTAEERRRIATLIDNAINRADCDADNDPGRVTMRRLNSAEYDNTVRDLFGIDFRPSSHAGLPSDDVGNGFDNQGEVLTMSPLLMEKYLDAGAEIAERAIAADRKRDPAGRRLLIAEPGEDLSPRAAAREVFARFLPRAYRRPVTPNEIERLAGVAAGVVERGGAFEHGVAVGVQAAMASPVFLFRVEEPGGDGPTAVKDFELASRLSYFLWASMPDEDLFRAAESGALQTEAGLAEQAERLLAAEESDALVTRFMAQWLGLAGFQEVSPNPNTFRAWNTRLREAMLEETLRFCRAVVAENRSLLDLFNADFTFVNPRLAELYGVDFQGQDPRDLYLKGPGYPDGPERRQGRSRGGEYVMEERWIRAPAPPGRRGLMTHASILALNSNPTATSPVKRGRWVLDVVLGDPPPPAPPSAPSLEETAADAEHLPLRDQLAVHRQNPSCASCHQEMDPIGLALENYDAIGRWRDDDRGAPIDAAGELDGHPFNGPEELLALVRGREDDIADNFVRRLMTYALGRGLRPADLCAVEEIVAAAKPGGYRISAVVRGIVLSEPFRVHGAAAP